MQIISAHSSLVVLDQAKSLSAQCISHVTGSNEIDSELETPASVDAKVVLDRHRERKGKGLWFNQVRIGRRNLGLSIGQKRKGAELEKPDWRQTKKESVGGGELEADIPIQLSGDDPIQPIAQWVKQRNSRGAAKQRFKKEDAGKIGKDASKDTGGYESHCLVGEGDSTTEEAGLFMPPPSPC